MSFRWRLRLRHPAHVHCCVECGREFYLCNDRDCGIAPEVCQSCEMDRQDAYFDSLDKLKASDTPKGPSRHEPF